MKCVSLDNTKVPNAYFIDGPRVRGTGKTFAYKCLINNYIEMGYDVIQFNRFLLEILNQYKTYLVK